MHYGIRNQKGFTLIELSIVLVIIGIILGAILKGQDLIDNSKAKKVASLINQWQAPMMGFYDRAGYLPGDSGVSAGSAPSGVLTSAAAVTAALSASGMTYPNIVAGDISVAITNVTNACGQGATKNIMLVYLPATASSTLVDAIFQNVDGTVSTSAITGRLNYCGAAGNSVPAPFPVGTQGPITYIF